MTVALSDAVAKTRSNGQEVERHQVSGQRSTNVHTFVCSHRAVALCEWVTSCFLNILRSTVPNGVFCCVFCRQWNESVICRFPSICYVLTEVCLIVDVSRSQRVDRNHCVQE